MPTISTSASIVTLLSVKSSAAIMPKVEMTDAGIATPAMTVARQLRMNSEHDEAREDAAEDEVDVDLVQRRVDVARLVADDLELDVGAAAAAATRSRFALTPSITATVLAPDWRRIVERHGRHAVQPRERALLLGAVLGAADVADADRRAVDAWRSPDR